MSWWKLIAGILVAMGITLVVYLIISGPIKILRELSLWIFLAYGFVIFALGFLIRVISAKTQILIVGTRTTEAECKIHIHSNPGWFAPDHGWSCDSEYCPFEGCGRRCTAPGH